MIGNSFRLVLSRRNNSNKRHIEKLPQMFQHCYLPAMQTGIHYLPSLSLSFPISQRDISILFQSAHRTM